MTDGSDRRPRYASDMAHPAPHPAQREESSADGTVIGAVLLVAGCGWLAQTAGIIAISWPVVLSASLVALGVSMIFTARRSTSGLVLAAGIAMTAVLAATTTEVNLDAGVLRSGAGDRTYRLTSVTDDDHHYATAAGELTVDLTDIDLSVMEPGATPATVSARVGVGQLRVIVPYELAVRVVADVAVGDIEVFGDQRAEGVDTSRTYEDRDYGSSDAKSIILRLSATIGHIEVVRGT